MNPINPSNQEIKQEIKQEPAIEQPDPKNEIVIETSLSSRTLVELKSMLKSYNLVNNMHLLNKEETIDHIIKIKKYKAGISDNYSIFKFENSQSTITLNQEQYDIVKSDINQHVRIIACAGSGKTTTIICRIKYLIDSGINPERIMLTTFSVDAALSMRNKITDLFGFMPKITIGTLDSIACKYYHMFFKQTHSVGVNEYANYFLKYLQSDDNLLSDVYTHIFFDEFQDVNQIQFDILKCFYKNGSYITVIGDDAQNIYQFRGSDVKFILNLEQYFPDVITYKLVNNYRSTPEIINMANCSIKFNTEQMPKDMIAYNKSINLIPLVKHYNNYHVQNTEIIDQIVKFKIQGVKYEDIAILSRLNNPLKLLEEDIEKYNVNNPNNIIPYVALINDATNDIKPKIKAGHITLTSIHKSKGLEWQIVFIIDCSDDKFPVDTSNYSLQEERRLFYVAVTRAKEYLYLYFCSNPKSKTKAKITRFVQELDNSQNMYNFVNSHSEHFDYHNERISKWDVSVTEIIRLINDKDMVELRNNHILPLCEPVRTQIHGASKHNEFIKSYYLQPEFGEFVDRYVTRTIGKSNPKTGGLVDSPTIIITSPNMFSYPELTIFKKYELNIRMNVSKMTIHTDSTEYIDILNQNDMGLDYMAKIEQGDIYSMISIINKILCSSTKYGINFNLMSSYFAIKNEVPLAIKNKYTESYQKYSCPELESSDILNDIYNVSLCGTIIAGRRRLMYKDVFKAFVNDYDMLFSNINMYVKSLDTLGIVYKCKKFINSGEYDIMGEIDLLDCTNGKIIDFKCSSSDNFKIEWLLQLLAYTAIIKKSSPETVINELVIYNPLMGLIYTLDVRDWNKPDEYLTLLYKIRVRQMMRGTKSLDNVNSLNDANANANANPNSNTMIKNDHETYPFEPIPNRIDKIIKHIGNFKLNLDLKTLFDAEYTYFLDYINSLDNSNQYDQIIKEINMQTNYKYVVLDTETTGLPEKNKFGMMSEYTNTSNYDTARLVQLCWAIYQNGKLLEMHDHLIKPHNFTILNSNIHGITHEMALLKGRSIHEVLHEFVESVKNIDIYCIVGHNIVFDKHILMSEMYRHNYVDYVETMKSQKYICTMRSAIKLKINGNLYPPKLVRLYEYLFGTVFENQHNAKYDVMATARVYDELYRRKLIALA